jgi:hypothetical protein
MTASAGVNVSACIELQSVTSALLLSRMTTTQMNAIVTPSNGMLIYNTTTNLLTAYINGAWTAVESGGAAPTFTTVTSGLGTAAAPSYTFTGRTDVGLYSSAAHTLDLTANGTRQVSIIGTAVAVDYLTIAGGAAASNTVTIAATGTDAAVGITFTPKGTGALLNAVGAVATPSYAFTGDLGAGMWHSAANTLDFSANAARQLQLIGTAVAVDYLTITGGATGTNTVTITTAGTDTNISLTLTPKGTGALLNAVGAVATPSYAFTGDAGSGMWQSAASVLDFSTTGVRSFQITDTLSSVNWVSVTGGATGTGLSTGVGFTANGTDTNIDISVTPKGAGNLSVRGATTAGSIALWNQANTFQTIILGAAVASNLTWTWPLTDATVPAGATTTAIPMSSNAAGVLSFSNTGLIYATGTLTAGNINSMFTTGIQLIATPGSGKAIIVQNFILEIIGATSFAAGGVVYLNYSTTGHGTTLASQIMPVTAVTAASSNNTIASALGMISNTVTPAAEGVQLVSTSVANQPVCITNATQLFTTGTGTANWYLWYMIVPVT